MKNKPWKKFKFQTESNKFYIILADLDFNKEEGIKLNPFAREGSLMDKEVIVVQEINLPNLPSLNIRNTDLGYFLEIYNLNDSDIYIVDKIFIFSEIIELISKLSQFSYIAALKYIKFKYGFKNQYLFF